MKEERSLTQQFKSYILHKMPEKDIINRNWIKEKFKYFG